MAVPTLLGLLLSSLVLHAAVAECPGEKPTKHLVCYVDSIPEDFDPCLCTHLVINTPLDKLSSQHEAVQAARRLQGLNPDLRLVARLSEGAEALRRRGALAHTVAGVVHKLGLDGVEIDLQWGKEVAAKVQLVDFVQALSKELAQDDGKERTKRSYKIHEDIPDDVVTPRWTLQANSRTNRRKTRDAEEKSTSTTEADVTTAKKEDEEEKKEEEKTTDTASERSSQQEIEEEEEPQEGGKLIILHLTSQPQHLAKNFDLKRLSKYVSFYTLASDNLTDATEQGMAYHPSRLMGIEDILNADSLIDLVTGLGAPHEKLILTLPATALRFTLQDKEKNIAQSPVTGPPSKITRAELCKLMSEGEWTVERDEDFTAPYAFHDKTWVAFEDPTSVSIKGKYVILRDLGGAAVSRADAEDWSSKCNSSARGASLLTTLHDTFTHVARKSRAAQLVDLQEQLHSAGHFSYSGDIHLSPYRIVRVVDRAGAIHVVRKEAKTEFECSRQGYFRHPSGCNRFYRCVKFNQYSPDYTVFEYDCPAGLAFDETVEVCVWPGSLADGGACQGSSEIAPVPRQRYVCPTTPGYYADPENCRWFFACLDHHGDGSTLTAYEFRCPFGLVFDEQALVCNWPWLVPGCGGSGVYSARFTVGDFFEGRHRPSYASVSDYHVSGGRIENVPGGVVLGSALSGLGSGAYGSYASGSNALDSGSAGHVGAGDGLRLGVYSSGGPGSGYVSGLPAGGLASGSYQGNYVSGTGSGYNAGSGAYSGSSGAGHSGLAGAGYSGSSGAGYSGLAGAGHSGLAGAGYSGSSGAGYSGSSGAGYAGSGAAYSGSSGAAGSKYASGIDTGSYVAGGEGSATYSGGAGYVGGVGGSSGFGHVGGYSAGGSAYSGAGINSGAYVAGGDGSGSAYTGSGAYSGAGSIKAGAGYRGSGKYSASYSEAAGGFGNAYTGGPGSSYSSSTKYGGASAYGGTYGGGSYYDQSGAYVHDNSGDYVHDGTGDTGGLYAGKESYGGEYTGGYVAGGAYVPGFYDNGAYKGSYSSGGQYKGSYVGGGEYSGTYDAGAYHGEDSSGGKYKGEYDAGAYSGKYDAGSYAGKYDTSGYSGKYDAGSYAGKHDTSGYSGKYDAGSYSGKYDGGAYSGKYDGGAYSGKYDGGAYTGGSDSQDYHGGNYHSGGSTSYQGGYKVHSAPGYVATGGEGHEYNSLHIAEHKPIGLVGLDAVKVTGGEHSGGYVSSYVTPSAVLASVTPVSPVVSSYSTVTPAPISISTYRPSTVQPTTPRPVTYYSAPSSTVSPVTNTLISYSSVKPPAYVAYEQPSYVKTVTPAAPVVSYPAPTIGVSKIPIVPLNPVTYTYKQPVVKNEYISSGFQYSTPAPVGVSYEQHSYVKPVAPTPLYQKEFVGYGYKQPVVKSEYISSGFQYSTPAPVGVSYEQPSYIKPVTPAPYYQKEFVDYGYKKPIPPAYLPPLPSYSYEYNPATYVKPVEVKYSYPKPAVLKTPIVPLNPIQYSTPAPITYSVAPLKPISYATPAPVAYPSYPSPAPVSYNGPKYLPPLPVEPVKPITYTTPAPTVFEYHSPAVKYTPTVLKTPVVPLNPVQYSTPAPVHFEYSTPSPVKTYSYSTPSPPVSYTPAPVRPLKPITYTTPAPPVSYEYSTPRPIQPLRPLRPISYSTPAPFVEYNVPTVLKTPVVPLNPIQYTTPAPVHFEYSTPAPPRPVSFVKPYSAPAPAISYGFSTPAPVQPVRPISYSTPAPAVNYQYSAPVVKPVVPLVVKTPVVPLNPIQYTTPAPQYEYKYSTPAPIAPVSYVKPLRPVAPPATYYSSPAPPARPAVSYYSSPAPTVKPVSYEYSHVPVQPVNYAKPLRPVAYSTPAPVINYEYSRPTVTPTVLKTPVVPLNPIQYTTPAPVHFQYSTPAPYPVKPITYTAPGPQINYEYVPQAPVVKPLKPISYSGPEYLPPVPVAPLKPLRPITYTTPAPAVTYEYSSPVVKPVVPTVLKTPVVPLNPIQYTTPAPVYFEHSTPAPYKPIVYSTPAPAVNYEYVPPAPRPLRPIKYSTPAPVTYEYLPPAPVQPVKPITLSSPAPFSYDYKYQPVKQVPAVYKTPVVPLNPIQYTTPAPAFVQYSTPAPTVSYVKPLKPIVYSTPAPPTISYEYSTPAPPQVTYGYKSTAYVKPIPTVLKTPVVPLNPVQYTTPAPVVNQYRFGVTYETPEIQHQPDVTYEQNYVRTKVVKEGYDYPKPAVRFEEAPKFVSTTPAPVTYTYATPEPTPVYKQVYDYVKTPVVSAYEKVLNAISYSTTPAPLPVQPVTQSPVSYAPVNVGPSYSRPALVKTQSIPLTPVAVVPEYQKVLNVVKATTTSSPLYVNHYASSYEPELIPVSTPRPVVYKKRPTVVQENTYVKDYSYEENIDDIYDAVRSDFGTKLAGGYEEGYVYNQQSVEVPQVKVYTSTTPAPVPVIKETYKVRRPVKTYVQTYEQPSVAVGYEAGSYEGGSSYSTTGAPAVVSSSEAVFGEQFHKETSFSGYTGVEGDSSSYGEIDQEIHAVPVYTSSIKPPTVKVTTARVSLPVVTSPRPEGAYYVRKQKVRVRPVVTTENYPDVYSSTYTPSTVSTTTFAPTYSYSSTPVVSSTTVHPDDVVDVEGEEEDGVKILEGFDGQYGGIVNKGYVSSTVASIEDGEAVVGILKRGKITYDGRRTKTKVVVVSKLSDFNPLLVGKLGAECSCDGRSNTVTVRRHKQRGSNKLFTPSGDSTIPDQQYVDTYQTSTTTAAPIVVNSASYESSFKSSSYDAPVVEINPVRKKSRVYSTTTSAPEYSEEEEASQANYVAAGERVKDRVECKRAGLFRHPKKCNKFYSCDWDQWKKKFTVNEFKCPIHLAYDANLGACNWPSKGPACADDNLLV